MQVWRNWQTRMVQVHMSASSCRFKSCHLHQEFVLLNELLLFLQDLNFQAPVTCKMGGVHLNAPSCFIQCWNPPSTPSKSPSARLGTLWPSPGWRRSAAGWERRCGPPAPSGGGSAPQEPDVGAGRPVDQLPLAHHLGCHSASSEDFLFHVVVLLPACGRPSFLELYP